MSAGWTPKRGPVFTWAIRLAVVAVLIGAGLGAYRIRNAQARASYPNAQAKKGEFLLLSRCRGSVVASRSVGIYTPLVPNLRIAWIAPAGSTVKAGDVIVKFDSSTAEQQLRQQEAQLRSAQASLDQEVAQAQITAQRDETSLADSKFSVETAGYTVQVQQLKYGDLAGQEANKDLEVAQAKEKLQEANVALHQASDASHIASLTRQRDKLQADVDLSKSRIGQMTLAAPNQGLLLFNMNYSGVYTTADAKPYKVGDNVGSNMSLGVIPDLNSLEMNVVLDEADRGRISAGQDAFIRVDALPELNLSAKVSDVTALAEMSMEYPYNRTFRASAVIAHPDSRLRPDMNGGLDVVIRRIPNAISIPAKAVFTHDGKPVVYIAQGGRYRAAEITIEARNPDEVAVTGVPAGASVALVDVAEQEGKK
ncbi:MAG TPA: efflux RND transporter periplasmic adaptor subunit [Bryobacteraceae bacterium]|nr:efflux RND transporter periplasmic adaptor subunit [Bryobacteraceae bacterium]